MRVLAFYASSSLPSLVHKVHLRVRLQRGRSCFPQSDPRLSAFEISPKLYPRDKSESFLNRVKVDLHGLKEYLILCLQGRSWWGHAAHYSWTRFPLAWTVPPPTSLSNACATLCTWLRYLIMAHDRLMRLCLLPIVIAFVVRCPTSMPWWRTIFIASEKWTFQFWGRILVWPDQIHEMMC